MKKISLAILLVMAMLLTLLPTAAMALEEVPEVVLPDGVTESNFGNNVVLFNNTYYSNHQFIRFWRSTSVCYKYG